MGDAGGNRGPLDGLLVADFSRVLAGPLATMWMADLGATVIKVERPPSGDDTRQWGPPWSESSSTYFTAANRSKSSVLLDLDQADDVQLARKLARRADVVVENFKTGALARFGLDYETVAETNARVVYASITGFGSRGGAHVPGYDFVVQAVGGLMSITGSAEGEPTKAGVALVDVLTAKDALIGVLAALRARERDNRGQHVEVNLLSSLLGSLANQASGYLETGTSPIRMGNKHPSIAPYETLQCGHGLLAVACGNDAQFARLCDLLEIPGTARDPRFSSNPARVKNRADMVAVLEERLATADAAQWERRCLEMRVPAGRVATLEEAFARAEDYGLSPVTQLPGGHTPQVAHPISYSGTTVTPPSPPPMAGADDERIRAWLMGDGMLNEAASLPSAEGDVPTKR